MTWRVELPLNTTVDNGFDNVRKCVGGRRGTRVAVLMHMLVTLVVLIISVFAARTRAWWCTGVITLAVGAVLSAMPPPEMTGLEGWFLFEFLIGPAPFVLGLGVTCGVGSWLVRNVVVRDDARRRTRRPGASAPRLLVRVLPIPSPGYGELDATPLGLAGLRVRQAAQLVPIRVLDSARETENPVISGACPGVSLHTPSGSRSRFKRSAV